MGLFHCPLGAAYYDDDGCIDCGLCEATTSEEKVEASRKIREYMKSHTVRKQRVSKIAVCGKGGTGKSTVTALMAYAFRDAGYTVMVLDSDESNPGLGRMLGMEKEPVPLGDLFNKRDGMEDSGDVSLSGKEAFSLAGIPEQCITGSNGISLMLTGKIHDPFQGCACSLAESARQIVEKLQAGENEVLIMDTEAGVESFGRGVERYVDTVLIVVEPSLTSIELAERIAGMALGMGVNRVGVVLNKMSSGEMAASVEAKLSVKKVKVLGSIKYDPLISDMSLEGKALLTQAGGGEGEAIRMAIESMTRD